MTTMTDWQAKYQNLLAVYLRQKEANRQQKKGIDRLRRKVEYYRQTTDNLMNLIQKSDNYDILYKEIPKDYDGPKPTPPPVTEIEMLKKERDHFKNRAISLAVSLSFANQRLSALEGTMKTTDDVVKEYIKENTQTAPDGPIEVEDTATGKGTVKFKFDIRNEVEAPQQ